MLCLGWVVWSVGTTAAQQPAKDSTPTKAQPPAAPAAAPAAPNAAGATPTAANAAASHPAAALGLTVYPAKSQTAAQQEADEQACYKWAGEQTGIDPATVKTPTQTPPRRPTPPRPRRTQPRAELPSRGLREARSGARSSGGSPGTRAPERPSAR